MNRSNSPRLPAGACDTHMHFYDRRFPTAANAVKRTPSDFVPADYRRLMAKLGTERLVAVQPTTYGLDNRCQLQAVAEFDGQARAVVVFDETVTDRQLADFHTLGVRGVRFFMWSGGALGWDSLRPVAERIAELGWHLELHIDGITLPDHFNRLRDLPCDVAIDHMGRFSRPVPTDHPANLVLDRLLGDGNWWVKLSAPTLQDQASLKARLDRLLCAVPDRLVWATNSPHPGQNYPPDEASELQDWLNWIGDEDLIRKIFCTNPDQLYDFS